MNEIVNIKEIIKLLPLAINYLVPGYIFFNIKNYFAYSKRTEDKQILLKSVLVSFIINSFINIFVDSSSKYFIFVSICLAAFLGLIYMKILDSSVVKSLVSCFRLTKSFHDDIFKDIIDEECGNWIRIFLENDRVIYTGQIVRYEDCTQDDHRYITINRYSVNSYDGEELCCYDSNIYEVAVINLKAVSRFELIYDEDSKKI